MAYLELPGTDSEAIPLGDVNSAGRSDSVDIQIDDRKSSREHFRIERNGASWRIVDLASSNGTVVNGAEISQVRLKDGDEIVVGDTVFVFHTGRPRPAAAPPAPAQRSEPVREAPAPATASPTPAAPPVASGEEPSAPRRRRRRAPAPALIIGALVLVGAIGLAFLTGGPGGGDGSDAAERLAEADDALVAAQKLETEGDLEAALGAFRELVDTWPRSRAAEEAGRDLRRLDDLLTARRNGRARLDELIANEAETPFRDLDRALRALIDDPALSVIQEEARSFRNDATRRFELRFRNGLSEARTEARRLTEEARWGAAVDHLNEFISETIAAGADDRGLEARRLKLEVLTSARSDWDALRERTGELMGRGEFKEARAVLRARIASYRGTDFEGHARARIQMVTAGELEAKRKAELAAAAAAGKATETEVASAKDPHAVALEKVVEAERLATNCDWSGAASRYDEALSGAVDDELAREWKGRRETMAALSGLRKAFIGRLAENKRMSRVRVGRLRAQPTAADDRTVTVDLGAKNGTTDWKWREIPSARLVELFTMAAKTPETRLLLAVACHAYGDRPRAEKLLFSLATKKDLKDRVDQAYARIAGIDVPAGGFVLVQGRLYTPHEAEQLAMLARAEKMGRQAAGARLEKFRELIAKMEQMGPVAERVIGETLVKRREAVWGRLQKHTYVKNLPKARSILTPVLDERRKEALKLIFDTKRYPYPYGPNQKEVQAEVNALVDQVRLIWETPTRYLVEKDEAFRAITEEVRELDLKLQRFDVETQGLDAMLAEVDKRIDIQTHSWSAADRKYLAEVKVFNDEIDSSVTKDERECYDATNAYRMLMGRRPVKIEETLLLAARGHSQEMHDLKYFSHTSPTKGRERPSQRARLAGWGGSCSENIARGSRTGSAAVHGWVNSSGHHRNILGAGWTVLGAGKSEPGYYWTQNFASGGSTKLSKKKKKEDKAAGQR